MKQRSQTGTRRCLVGITSLGLFVEEKRKREGEAGVFIRGQWA